MNQVDRAFLVCREYMSLRPGDVFTWFHEKGEIWLTRGDSLMRWRAGDSCDHLSGIKDAETFKSVVQGIAWSHGLVMDLAAEADLKSHAYRVTLYKSPIV